MGNPLSRILSSDSEACSKISSVRNNDLILSASGSKELDISNKLRVVAEQLLSQTALPSKPCRTTSALIDKAYMTEVQAGMSLHTMVVFLAYQTDLLREWNSIKGLNPKVVVECCLTMEFALPATKLTASAIGCSMAAIVQEVMVWPP